MCQSRLTRHTPDVMTVRHCGVSEVKYDINSLQFLAQTDRFVSYDINVSSRAASFNLNLCVLVFLLKDSVPIDLHYMTDRLQRFELKIFVCVLLKKQSPTSWMPWGQADKHQIFTFG